MMWWDLLNSLGRISVTLVMVVALERFRDMLNPWQRIGMGLAGGGSLLTVNIIWEGSRSPYDGWAVTAFTYGVLSFAYGTVKRYWKHDLANKEQIRRALEWKRNR